MKICICVGALGPGGAEKVATILANYLSINHDVFLIETSCSVSKPFYHIEETVNLCKIPKASGKEKIFIKMYKMRKLFKHLKPDCIITFLSHVSVCTYFSSRGLKTKFIVSERNNPYTTPTNKVLMFLRNYVFKKADGCVFQTNDAAKYFKKKIRRYKIIKNPVSLSVEPPKSNLQDREKSFVLVGSNKQEKNRKMAYEAFSKIHQAYPQFTLDIFGENSYSKDKEFLSRLQIEEHVKFHGVSNNWHNFAVRSKAFVMTSDFEGFPNALLEAAALRLPCISTNCPIGGPREILEDGKKGILIECNNAKELYEKMKLLIERQDLCDFYFMQNLETAYQYSKEKICSQWLSFIDDVCCETEGENE